MGLGVAAGLSSPDPSPLGTGLHRLGSAPFRGFPGLLCQGGTWALSPEARGLTNVIPGLVQAAPGGGARPGSDSGPAAELSVALGASSDFAAHRIFTCRMPTASPDLLSGTQ